jgi:hypothetical protein
MNIIYDIDSNTGLLKLKFKENIISSLDPTQREAFEKYLLPLLAMNSNFVLTGSLSLKLLSLEPLDSVGDFDLGLSEEFTEDDYNNIKNFFDFHDIASGYDRELANPGAPKYKFNPKAHMWQFSKRWDVGPDANGILSNGKYIKIDIFNDEILRKKDIIEVYFDDFPIRLIHPSITLSYRMRYALDQRSSTSFKYWERMIGFIKDAKSYYLKIRAIYKMIARVYEHNANIEGNAQKISLIRSLADKRECTADEFFNRVFKETIDPFTFLLDKEEEQFTTKQQGTKPEMTL